MITSFEDMGAQGDDAGDGLSAAAEAWTRLALSAAGDAETDAATSRPTQKDDILKGDGDPDVVDGLAGEDEIQGRGGDDTLYGGAGADTLRGGEGDDDLFGGQKGDRLLGGEGTDDVDGGGGADLIDGGAGDDFLIGGDGRDTILGGGGADLVTGGAGKDLFVVEGGDAAALSIADFLDGEDRIGISGVEGVDSFADVKVEFGGCGIVVTDENATFSIVLFGYFGALDEADFLFS